MATRLGVDVGGTFTDLIFYDDETGEVRVSKEPTTPAAPQEGVLAAVAAAVPREKLAEAAYFLHGTTVGLNSLLTRTGAVVGLLATRGFRDILEMARGDRGDPYDLFWRQPEPLVPRRLRLPVTERIRANGEVWTELEEDDVRAATEVFAAEGTTSVAVAFLNSYANPAHELAAERALRAAGFAGEISLSHRISGEYREYERTSTTVIDAYVRPRMTSYLRALDARLREAGFGGEAIVTRSGGGAMTFAEAEERPFETIMSGPVAGAEGAGELARRLGLDEVITADVGRHELRHVPRQRRPAAADVRGQRRGDAGAEPVGGRALDRRGRRLARPRRRRRPAEGRARQRGRGSRARPATGAAAPSRPSPTPLSCSGCSARGSSRAGSRSTGTALSPRCEPLAERLELGVEEVARGVLTIAAANMANAIREITIERGRDPRGAALMPFGGAGPLFGTLLARELEIREIVLPPHAGNFSAWGLLGADLTQTAARTRIMRLEDGAVGSAGDLLCATSSPRSPSAPRPRGEQAREVASRHAVRRPGAHAHRRGRLRGGRPSRGGLGGAFAPSFPPTTTGRSAT